MVFHIREGGFHIGVSALHICVVCFHIGVSALHICVVVFHIGVFVSARRVFGSARRVFSSFGSTNLHPRRAYVGGRLSITALILA